MSLAVSVDASSFTWSCSVVVMGMSSDPPELPLDGGPEGAQLPSSVSLATRNEVSEAASDGGYSNELART